MPISVEEVTADVTLTEPSRESAAARDPEPPTPSAVRRWREQLERLQQRAQRVKAN